MGREASGNEVYYYHRNELEEEEPQRQQQRDQPQRRQQTRRRSDEYSDHMSAGYGRSETKKNEVYVKKEGPVGERFKSIGDVAREKLKVFRTQLNGLRAKNSDVYNNMVNALEKVAEMGSGADPEAAGQALDELQKAAQAYHKSRSGLFKSKTGRARLNAASDLVNFAKEAN